MEFISLENYTKEFFDKEKSNLEKSYPGITLRRILDELRGVSTLNANDEKVKDFFKELLEGKPLEYISNNSYFFHSNFYVDERVLIPRNETEILVEYAVEFTKKNFKAGDRLSVCDIGTGSGAIILSYMQEVDNEVSAVATDISKEALAVATKNDFLLRFKYPKKSSMSFQCSDRLSGIEEDFDIIMSNPPYIKEINDKGGVHHQVDAYEPHLALYIKDSDYDVWFLELFKQVKSRLKEGGLFIMEGHEEHLLNQGEALKSLGFENVEVLKDYTGRDRFIKGIKNAKIIS